MSKSSDSIEEAASYTRSLIESSLDPLVTIATDGAITDVNLATEQITGYSKEELVGTDFADYFTDPDKATAGYLEAYEKGSVRDYYLELKHKDGRVAPVLYNASVYKDSSGNVVGVFAAARDISQQIEAKKQLEGVASYTRSLIESSLDPLVTIATDGAITDVNLATEQITGYSKEELVGTDFADYFTDPDKATAGYLEAYEKGSVRDYYLELKHKDGRVAPVLYNASVYKDSSGNVVGVFAAARDISQQIEAEKIQLSDRVFRESHDGIIITNSRGVIVDINPTFTEITGYSRKDVIGQNPNILSSGKQSSEFYSEMWDSTIKNGHWQGEVWNRKKNGELYAELLSISSLADERGNTLHYVGIFSDITNSKKQQEKLELMAHYDVLTKLPNRALFADRFVQEIAHSKRNKSLLGVCFLDLDNFKPVNDNYGHDAGDQLLVEVAKRIKSNIRGEDTVSRQGGDEFAILLGSLKSVRECEQTLERIHHALAQPYIIDNHSHNITVSAGVTIYPTDNSDIDTLIRHADQAMYEAKRSGRNCFYFFNAQQDEEELHKHHRLDEIQNALQNEEFELYYQPKVNMKTGHAFGAEALIRWIHPEKGLVPPLDFLPITEGTALEINIGNWVIEQALRQLAEWQGRGLELEVSVNISSKHLTSPLFVKCLTALLAKYPSIDSKYLQLEILESSVLTNVDTIRDIIRECRRKLGVSVALDDFGTGYSSLTHLRNLPVSRIKIDQSFVRDMLDDPSDYAIIDGVIGLSDSFNKDVIAEGVETLEHGLMLLVMGCNEAQGYGISKPIPASEFQVWMSQYVPNQAWIECGKKRRTLKEKKFKIFKLSRDQWWKSFEKNIQLPSESVKSWPIMDQAKCPCGIWLKRARQDYLFEESWLDRFDVYHTQLHSLANKLLEQYNDGSFDSARDGLEQLQAEFEKMGSIHN